MCRLQVQRCGNKWAQSGNKEEAEGREHEEEVKGKEEAAREPGRHFRCVTSSRLHCACCRDLWALNACVVWPGLVWSWRLLIRVALMVCSRGP